MIDRKTYFHAVQRALKRSPITALLGPRQCGKTTLAQEVASHAKTTYLDLESHTDQARLEHPLLLLGDVKGLVVIDEIQQRPDLFSTLRVLADRPPKPVRFLILGSASPSLIKQASESLAGRVEFVEMGGFGIEEIAGGNLERLWIRGGFPRSFLARTNADSVAWRESFIQTFLQRDIPQLGIPIPAAALRRFWTMLAHYHGQTWNASELSQSLGLSDKTLRHYLDLLTGTYMVRQLQPWHVNIGKRQVKAPKIYLRDSGILHSLLVLPDKSALWGHPKVGASWEGFALEQVIRVLKYREAYFWATYSGAELDLFVMARGKGYGVEFKWSEAPRMTRSLHAALEDLSLAHAWVVYPGDTRYALHKRVTALPLREITAIAETIR